MGVNKVILTGNTTGEHNEVNMNAFEWGLITYRILRNKALLNQTAMITTHGNQNLSHGMAVLTA